MPTLAEINEMDRAAFTAVLGGLFEHSPWVAEETWDRRLGLSSLGEAGPFREAAQLQAELCATMRGASRERQLALIRAHPDLAGRLALAGKLTAESTREQASAGLTGMGADEFGAFQKLNDAYRARFGFPFIICARLNARAAILSAMQTRISNTPEQEHAAALAEIEKIAGLRLQDVLKT